MTKALFFAPKQYLDDQYICTRCKKEFKAFQSGENPLCSECRSELLSKYSDDCPYCDGKTMSYMMIDSWSGWRHCLSCKRKSSPSQMFNEGKLK